MKKVFLICLTLLLAFSLFAGITKFSVGISADTVGMVVFPDGSDKKDEFDYTLSLYTRYDVTPLVDVYAKLGTDVYGIKNTTDFKSGIPVFAGVGADYEFLSLNNLKLKCGLEVSYFDCYILGTSNDDLGKWISTAISGSIEYTYNRMTAFAKLNLCFRDGEFKLIKNKIAPSLNLGIIYNI